ncbi:polyketide synthase [Beggiatoa sp. SS]|nr:polyketide synthase [Beggiatoa sp. SS]
MVAARGQLIQSLPPGAMLAVALSEEAVQAWLTPELSLAVINGVERCVVAGSDEAIDALQQKLQLQGIETRVLQTSHAFHSHLLEPVLASFTQQLRQVQLYAPTLPYLSNLTGTWISPELATDPDYWVRHLRHTVRFADRVISCSEREGPLGSTAGASATIR